MMMMMMMMMRSLILHILEIFNGANFVQSKTCMHVCACRVAAYFYFKGFKFILLPKYHHHLYFCGGGGMIVHVSDMHFSAGVRNCMKQFPIFFKDYLCGT
jgi:hypothetical protein